MEKRTVVVLMSTYNGEQYLREQIESILKQEGDFQLNLLVRDDGSTDQTVMILKEYQSQYSNFSFYEGENIGYVKSFFDLIEHAGEYDYYSFSDQDDVWMLDKIQVALQHLAEMPFQDLPMLYASCSLLVDNDLVEQGKTQEQVRPITPYNGLIECFFPGHTQVLNRRMRSLVVEKIDRNQIYAHDFWISTLAINFGKVVFDNIPHTYYRQHSSNVTGYSIGMLGWIKQRYMRVRDNQANLRSNQIAYFANFYRGKIDDEVQKELDSFYASQSSLLKRIGYILNTKFYYQSSFKSIFYRLLYVYGGFKPTGGK